MTGALTMIEERGGAADARLGSIDLALDNRIGLFGRGRGLHSRRRVVQTILVGDWDRDGDGSTRARRLTDEGRRCPGDGIVCVDRKNGNRFYVSTCALCHGSTSIEGDVVRIMGKDSGHASATVP